jgi:catecholate siderophore receptor
VVSTLLLSLSLATLIHASDEAGQVTGRVIDQNRAPIAGAQVTVSSKDGSELRTTITNSQGEFTVSMGVGEYVVKVSAKGFSDASRPADVSNGSTIEIIMSVADANASVNVEAVPDYVTPTVSSATKTATLVRDVPQAVAVVTKEQMQDQLLTSIGDILRYTPGISVHQGENNRDEAIIRGQNSSSSFFLNGVRDDVQYYRDPYNLERLETLKGPNAMIFGRGGGGGVINRVTKEADFAPLRQAEIQGGSFWNRRFAGDFDQPINDKLAFRLNGVYENSNSFRQFVNRNTVAVNPTLTFKPNNDTRFTISYEFARDRRTADRGITSFNFRPAEVPIYTFYGNPDDSHVRSNVNIVSGTFDQQIGRFNIHNRTTYGDYDRFYQNYVPGAANILGTLVTLTAYNNATKRKNFFSQTDLSYIFSTGKLKHTIVWGTELGNQRSDNFRNTGFFNNTLTSVQVDFNNPTTTIPVTFRQAAADADNHVSVNLAAGYVQDQVDITRFLKVVAGVRYDYFDLKYHNNRDGSDLRRIDNLVSPRVGIVIKPVEPLSIYANYSVSYLPGSGDQFSSLTVITQPLKPEKFSNYEVGVKWDIRRNLSLTSALFRLDRTNTRAADPDHPGFFVQTGSQRTNGFEIGFTGLVVPKWQINGGYSYQDAFITSATVAAPLGNKVGQTPHNSFTFWNRYQVLPKLGLGLGLIGRSEMFVSAVNATSTVLPGYVRADAAVFYTINEHWRIQGNVENLFNKKYIINADSNTNLSPGQSRGLKIGLVARF